MDDLGEVRLEYVAGETSGIGNILEKIPAGEYALIVVYAKAKEFADSPVSHQRLLNVSRVLAVHQVSGEV